MAGRGLQFFPAPPSVGVISLAAAGLPIYVLLLGPLLVITWRHGRKGMTCWPLLVSFFGMHIAYDAYTIARRHDALVPEATRIMMNAGLMACAPLALLGATFEA